MKTITFFGATGMLGQPVAKKLAKAGFEVVAMVRDVEKARKLFPPSIQLVQGDLKKPSDIEKAITGADAIYINLSVAPNSKKTGFQPERDALPKIVQKAKLHGIKRIGYISSLVHFYQGMNHFNWWVFDIKKDGVKHVKKCGIPYTIFYPSTFMENFDKGGYKQGNKLVLVGKSEHPQYFIAGKDYAKQVAESFSILTTENREYVAQGPEGFTTEQAAEVFVKHYPQELKITHMSVGLLKFIANFSRKANYGCHIIEAINKYPEKFKAKQTWAELGKPKITLEEYAKKAYITQRATPE